MEIGYEVRRKEQDERNNGLDSQQNEQDKDNNLVAPWTSFATENTCKNHRKEILPAAPAGTKGSSEGIQYGDVIGC